MSDRLEIFLVGNMWIIGPRTSTECQGPSCTVHASQHVAQIASPGQVVAMPMPTAGGGLAMGWAVLPLPIDALQIPGGVNTLPRGMADETMVQQYTDQLAEVKRRQSPLTLPRGRSH